MTINFENESETALDLPLQELAAQVIEKGLDILGCPYETEIGLLITDPEPIREINERMRGIDSPTDVLSFPLVDFPGPAEFDFLEDPAQEFCFHPETGELMLGDIVINARRVIDQASEYGHSIRREYAFLVAHSLLHLCGYDHMEENDSQEMEKMQRTILDALGIGR